MENAQLPLLAALVPKAVIALLLRGHIIVELLPLEAQAALCVALVHWHRAEFNVLPKF